MNGRTIWSAEFGMIVAEEDAEFHAVSLPKNNFRFSYRKLRQFSIAPAFRNPQCEPLFVQNQAQRPSRSLAATLLTRLRP